MHTPALELVLAAAENDVIGRGNALPWHLPADLRRFKSITLGKPVLMGRSMIELFLRGQQWSAADEILSANREHVHTVKITDPLAAVVTDTGWKAPWD